MDAITLPSARSNAKPSVHDLNHAAFPNLNAKNNLPANLNTTVSFYLWHLGGRWEGHVHEWTEETMRVHLNGFPPIARSQCLQLYVCLNGQERTMQHFRGLIKELHVETGPSAWEGTTCIVLSVPGWRVTQYRLNVVRPETNSPLGRQEETYVFGRISEVLPQNTVPPENRDRNFSFLESPTLEEELAPQDKHRFERKSRIQSTRLNVPKSNGQYLSAFYDRPIESMPYPLPVVILAPGYGETKRDYLTLAYYFAGNGFQVVRYDHSNHVGESDGSHYHITLSSMKDDFQAITRYVEKTFPQSSIIGVATSLAARVALKAVAEHPSLSLLVLLMGIINVRRSAAAVHQEDIFGDSGSGHLRESANFLGFNVGNQFLRDAITNRFVTLEHTLEDAERLPTPTIMVTAGKDAWVANDDLNTFEEALGARLVKRIDLPEALHRLQENPKIARDAYYHLVSHCREHMSEGVFPGMIVPPCRWELGRQNRGEKHGLQKHEQTDVGHAFWRDYLENFQSVGQCLDYVKLLDHLFQTLGPVLPGHQILDAGCGNGNAGLFLLKKLQSRDSDVPPFMTHPVRYVGIDVVPEALKKANKSMMSVLQEFQEIYSVSVPMIRLAWSKVDLGRPLPFPDGQFDRIISNLVLGYVRDPLAAVNELYRVLAPGGRIVMSNLKPNGDFSEIYQNLVTNAARPEQRHEARHLLNNYGKIRQAEKEGQFHFYDRPQWESILSNFHGRTAVYPTFAGQAFLVVLEKPAPLHRNLIPSPQHAGEHLFKRVA